ncbi:hypothetical protein [Fluviispira sanaruensis]|uniref:Outer membrane protein beta-barrel domain-containing protein n=1 Tax=Fluviispira sanaruensis TaxID=2493639 RepID=A0A4P2VK33_FLUSA|nr:hypothetical protein [Fluviispira sanaruensis]BBH53623.1 hypothetical protein JCM31447_20700 [Fluviispira sanaruensis]
MRLKILISMLFILFHTQVLSNQNPNEDQINQNNNDDDNHFFGGEWYVSWGYNKDYWRPTDIHVVQKSLNNDFTVHDVHAVDYPQWDTGYSIFTPEITTPQWNLRIGRYIDAKRNYALEFSFDHTKFSSVIDQNAHITGTIGGQSVDMYHQLTTAYFRYDLHNGANHIMFNIVRRFSLAGEVNQDYSLNTVVKLGAGIMLPHADNSIFGNQNNNGGLAFGNWFGLTSGWWQLNGITTGVEAGLQFVFWKPFYLEFTFKEAIAKMFNVPVYQGVADHVLIMSELILSVGYTFNSR